MSRQTAICRAINGQNFTEKLLFTTGPLCTMALPIHVQNCVSAIRSPPAGSRATESDGAAHR